MVLGLTLIYGLELVLRMLLAGVVGFGVVIFWVWMLVMISVGGDDEGRPSR